MAPGDQLTAHFGKVVDLAVEHDLHAAILVANRLIASRQVDDAQPAMAQADAIGEEVAGRIGSAMHHGIRHRDQHIAVYRMVTVEVETACNTTHKSVVSRQSSVISRQSDVVSR